MNGINQKELILIKNLMINILKKLIHFIQISYLNIKKAFTSIGRFIYKKIIKHLFNFIIKFIFNFANILLFLLVPEFCTKLFANARIGCEALLILCWNELKICPVFTNEVKWFCFSHKQTQTISGFTGSLSKPVKSGSHK